MIVPIWAWEMRIPSILKREVLYFQNVLAWVREWNLIHRRGKQACCSSLNNFIVQERKIDSLQWIHYRSRYDWMGSQTNIIDKTVVQHLLKFVELAEKICLNWTSPMDLSNNNDEKWCHERQKKIFNFKFLFSCRLRCFLRSCVDGRLFSCKTVSKMDEIIDTLAYLYVTRPKIVWRNRRNCGFKERKRESEWERDANHAQHRATAKWKLNKNQKGLEIPTYLWGRNI